MVNMKNWFYFLRCGWCSNFRPTAAKAIYDINTLGDKIRVYDYAAGFGGRLLGAWASDKVAEYVAVDVNTVTVGNAEKLIKYLNSRYPTYKHMEVKLLWV